MASLEKLIKTIEQIKTIEYSSADANAKKKELRIHLLNVIEFTSNATVQSHKDFVTHLSPSLDALIRFCDSKDSDIRLASEEGLCKVIKTLLPLHSNRVLVEFCKQIKKSDSNRVLKLSMNRFAELCHLARPQKRRAFLANLFNAITNIASQKEDVLHESLANFIQKVFSVMGIFAFESETKALLKIFLNNLASESSIIRRSSANCISAIITSNRKSENLLHLVVEYLTDQILVPDDNQSTIATPVIIGTLLTLKLLLPLFSSISTLSKSSQQINSSLSQSSTTSTLSLVTTERIIQIFELSIHYSKYTSDHNVVNAALEVLQQLLKMRSLLFAIPAFKSTTGLQGTRMARLPKVNSQWNVAPLPVAEESHLLEAEISLAPFGIDNSDEVDVETENTTEESEYGDLGRSKSAFSEKEREFNNSEESETVEPILEKRDAEPIDTSPSQVIDIGSLYDKRGVSPLLYASRHLAYCFLLSDQKGNLKSDRLVRVSVKNLALNCLVLVGSLEPLTWETSLSLPSEKDKISIMDVLLYNNHDDPQLRGQAALFACGVLNTIIGGYGIAGKSVEELVRIIEERIKDKEVAACRLSLQGIQQLLPTALESPFCSKFVPVLQSLLTISENPYWLVKVDLLDVFSSIPWEALEFGIGTSNETDFNFNIFQKNVLLKTIFPLMDDEDNRVRIAVASCISSMVKTWTTSKKSPDTRRVKRLVSNVVTEEQISSSGAIFFCNVPLYLNGLADAYRDVPSDQNIVSGLKFFIDELLRLLVTSNSKFSKMGCIQSLAALSCSFPPTAYLEAYGCSPNDSCTILKIVISLMTSSNLMLDLSIHQALLTIASQVFAGCVKSSSSAYQMREPNNEQKEWRFLNNKTAEMASCMLGHVCRVLNAFCCILEDLNPFSSQIKSPLVALPTPSALSPIRRKSKANESGGILDKDEKPEDLGRKWIKPSQLLSPNNLGFFSAQPLYVKLYDLLKGTYSTCKLSFDTATSERLSYFLQSILTTLATVLEVSLFNDMAQNSEEILSYLRWIITIEPVSCLYNVQQLLKALFGANLAALWGDEVSKYKRTYGTPKRMQLSTPVVQDQVEETFYSICGIGVNDKSFTSPSKKANSNRTNERGNIINKFRTSGSKSDSDKAALSSYIRLFEQMVIKALKLYTVTSSPLVQKQVLDLLCELIHLCVNYCLLDADQVFLNFVIQQFEFLEEGFIPQVEILLPSMFRFLSLLSYDRFHSKTIISVPRIMHLSGGLMATGKDAQLYVLPTLEPIVEDLFLSKERMNDDFKELQTQREVLINILLRLIQYPKVYPLLSSILLQVQTENATKWNSLSKQIIDTIIPQLHKHSLELDASESLGALWKLLSHLNPPMVQESLLQLLQTFAPMQMEDSKVASLPDYHRVLACRFAVMDILLTVFDESFLLDCLNEFNLSYLVNQNSDPLSVTVAESFPPERILSSLLVNTLKAAMCHWRRKFERDNSWASCVSWKLDDTSFSVRLLIDYISLLQRLKNSNDFPVLKIAIQSELEKDECKFSLFRMSNLSIPNNPLVFVRLCELLPKEINVLSKINTPLQFTGLNGCVAHTGLFLVQYEFMVEKAVDMTDFVNSHAHQILQHVDYFVVTHSHGKDGLFKHLANNAANFDPLLNCLFDTHGKSMVTLFMSLIKILEMLETKHQDVIIKVIRSLLKISNGLVQYKLCELIQRKWNVAEVPKTLVDILAQSPNQRYYSKLITAATGKVDLATLPQLINIDKAFAVAFALQKKTNFGIWNNILSHMSIEDMPLLLSNKECLISALTSCRLTKPDLFSFSKNWLTNESGILDNKQQILLASQILIPFFEGLKKPELKSIFSSSDVCALAKVSLCLIVDMNSFYPGVTLLRAASEVIAKLETELITEWAKIDNILLVYRAINSLLKWIVSLRNGLPLDQLELTGFEQSTDLDPEFVNCACRLSQMVTFLERQSKQLPDVIRSDLTTVVVAFCRMPLFYSYVALNPPSVWNKGWTTNFKLDTERMKLDMAAIPSHFLLDEVALKEFVYRVETIGWISKLKFEEIWMAFLGILNLNNEDQVRPEEQASVVQATCDAVRTLTTILQKHLLVKANARDRDESFKFSDFMQTERGEKLRDIYTLLECGGRREETFRSPYEVNCLSFRHIEYNLDLGSPSKRKTSSPEDLSHIDVYSCVHFLMDLYKQWLESSDTSYALLVELFRSLGYISNFFTDIHQFEWMLHSALNVYKQILPDDPHCLECSLTLVILKSTSFTPITSETWEVVKKVCETSLNSQHLSTRASALEGLVYLLQKFNKYPEPTRSSTVINLTMNYLDKYLGTENPGPDWHHSWLWSLTFYCGEHFAEFPFRNRLVIDFVAQSALNGLLEHTSRQSFEIQHAILQGLERLCILNVLPSNWRKLVKKEVINVIRNVEWESLLKSALRTLLSLVYSDFGNQLYKPGDDPETMLLAMEWVGSLFQRMKRGTDQEALLLGTIMPTITCDIFPPADILNRILSEFMTSRPLVAYNLTPTIFKVFGTARSQDQQSLVIQWILLSLANFTEAATGAEDFAVWNILCFFCAASNNPWLKSLFPLVIRPVNQNDPSEVQLFVASVLDFKSQLDGAQGEKLAKIFQSAKEKNPFFAAADRAINHIE